MGNTILISVFDTEPTAFAGLAALKELHRSGDITLYASTVIAKDASGKVAVRQTADSGPVGTLVGMVTGGLVGLLGGPVGVAVGAYVGGFGGLMYDLFNTGIGLDFVDEVSASLIPGKAAVIADVDETWPASVDTILAPLGATTFRRTPADIVDGGVMHDVDAARAELDQLDAERRQATGEAKANAERKIQAQRQKVQAQVDRVDKRLTEQEAELQARLATLRDQQAKVREDQHEQIAARTESVKASFAARKAKLEEARGLAKASLEATREALVP